MQQHLQKVENHSCGKSCPCGRLFLSGRCCTIHCCIYFTNRKELHLLLKLYSFLKFEAMICRNSRQFLYCFLQKDPSIFFYLLFPVGPQVGCTLSVHRRSTKRQMRCTFNHIEAFPTYINLHTKATKLTGFFI